MGRISSKVKRDRISPRVQKDLGKCTMEVILAVAFGVSADLNEDDKTDEWHKTADVILKETALQSTERESAFIIY